MYVLAKVRALALLPGFDVPSEEETKRLRKGDHAKLAFEFPEEVQRQRLGQWHQAVRGTPAGAANIVDQAQGRDGAIPPASGERMWVEVVRVHSGAFHNVTVRYKGILHNHPAVIDGLHWGDLVEFGPENVMAIQRRGARWLFRRRANLPPA